MARGRAPGRHAAGREIDGEPDEEGSTSGVPGGDPAGWPKRHPAAYGLALRPRRFVPTGTPVGPCPVRPGDGVRVTAEGPSDVEAKVVSRAPPAYLGDEKKPARKRGFFGQALVPGAF